MDEPQLQSILDNMWSRLNDFDAVQLAIDSKDEDYDLKMKKERVDFENSFYV